MEIAPSNKTLSLMRLVMINIIAVDSLRNLSITAQAGWVVITFYVLAAIFFLIPCALLTAEMATGWPKTGGIYLWTKHAFGPKFGFNVLWLQWIYNLVWFPSICGFFAGVIAYVIAPMMHQDPNLLVNNPWYMISMSLMMFWSATAVNLFGIKTSSTVSVVGAIVGTLLPMGLIIGLALFWFTAGQGILEAPTWCSFIPNLGNIGSWALFLTVMFSLFGLEMSSIHAGNVKNPQKNFPRALLISGGVIILSLMLSNIAIIAVSSQLHVGDVDIVTGLMVSFHYFFSQMGVPWLSVVIAFTLILGAFTTTSAWIMGLSRAFMVAGEDGLLPKRWSETNDKDAPAKILVLQGMIFSVFCLAYLVMPSVNSAYWYLSDLTAQLAVLAYLGMFAAALKLRMKHPVKPSQFEIYKGTVGTTIMVVLGCIGCISAMLVGFIPTEDAGMSALKFDSLLIAGMVIALVIPYFITRKYQPNPNIHHH